MLSIKINILYIILMIIIAEIQTLVELTTEEDVRIAASIIRNTTNRILAALSIPDLKWNPKLNQFFTRNNYSISKTPRDFDNLKETAGLLRVNNIDNNTQYLITKVNEILKESDKTSDSNGNVKYVANYIETLIDKLKHMKEKYVFNSNAINATILNDLKNNVTALKKKETRQEEIRGHDDDDDLWKPSGRRLYRGFRTRIKNYPFMASVQFFKKFQCAGSIIKNDLVITSASCLQLSWNNRFFRENPAFLSVQIGSDYYEHGGENIDVQEIYFYPTYDPKTLNNNLAIMRLSRQISFKKKSRRVKKIDIDRKASKWEPKSNFDILTVIGWGARDSSNIIYDVHKNRLSYSQLDYYPLDECQHHYSRKFVTKRNFCAGFFSKGGGACNRDAGGPAIINGILLGVISFGSPICGLPDSPTVFTKLGFYADWIDDILEIEVPYTYKRTTTPILPRTFILTEKPDTRITPIGTTSELTPIEILAALRIPQQHVRDDFLPSEIDNKKAVGRFKIIKSQSVKIGHQDLETNKKHEKSSSGIDNKEAVKPHKIGKKEHQHFDDTNTMQEKIYSGIDKKEAVEYFEIVTPQSIKIEHQHLETNKKQKKLTTQKVKVTAIIPIIGNAGESENELDLLDSGVNQSNDPPNESGSEDEKRVTVLENVKEPKDIKSNIMALIDNLDMDKLLNETDKSKKNKIKTEEAREAKTFNNNNLKEPSPVKDSSSSGEDEGGLSISMDSFQTLRILPKAHDYDRVSESLLFKVVSEAIEEEIIRQVRRKNTNFYSKVVL